MPLYTIETRRTVTRTLIRALHAETKEQAARRVGSMVHELNFDGAPNSATEYHTQVIGSEDLPGERIDFDAFAKMLFDHPAVAIDGTVVLSPVDVDGAIAFESEDWAEPVVVTDSWTLVRLHAGRAFGIDPSGIRYDFAFLARVMEEV